MPPAPAAFFALDDHALHALRSRRRRHFQADIAATDDGEPAARPQRRFEPFGVGDIAQLKAIVRRSRQFSRTGAGSQDQMMIRQRPACSDAPVFSVRSMAVAVVPVIKAMSC